MNNQKENRPNRFADLKRVWIGTPRTVILAVSIIWLLAFAGAAQAVVENIKLNPTLIMGGNVDFSYRMSPDGAWVVYVADQDEDGINELYSVPTGGPATAATKLNPVLVMDGNVIINNFQISADNSTVVYLADQDTDGVIELYSVPIDGSEVATRLNPYLDEGESVSGGFQISLDSSTVVYIAQQDTVGVVELYSVPIGGGTAIKLNPVLATGGGVSGGFQISLDSSTVVYLADQDTFAVFELYSVLIDGSVAATKLNPNLVPDENVTDFKISPYDSRVVYVADQDIDEVFEIYSVPIGGPATAATKLNPDMIPGIQVFPTFQFSADSSTVVYQADQDTDGVFELYSVLIDGSVAATKLNPDLNMGQNATNFKISPDGLQVVYQVDQAISDSVVELYSVPIDGTTSATKLNPDLDMGESVSGGVQISANSSTVVYKADQDTDGVEELYSVPIGGGTATKLNDPLVMDGDVRTGYQISPDNTRVVYRADQDMLGDVELYSVPIGGGTATKLNPVPVGSNVFSFSFFLFSPDSTRVVYRADQDTDGVFELYMSRDTKEAITSLLDSIDQLVSDGTLKTGQSKGLWKPLENALRSLDKGKINSACNQLQDFIDKANQKVADGALPQADADIMIDLATDLRTELGCL